MGVVREKLDMEMRFPTFRAVSQAGGERVTNTSHAVEVDQKPGDQSSGIDTVAVLVSVCVGIVVLVTAVLVTCVVCVRRRKRSKKRQIAMKYDKMFTTPGRPSPFSVVSSQMQLNVTKEQRSVYNALDLVTDRPQFKDIELGELDRDGYHGDGGGDGGAGEKVNGRQRFLKHHSLEATSDCPKRPKPLKKSKSAASLLTSDLHTHEPEPCEATISFSLKYVPASRQLVLRVHGADELPVKACGYVVYVTAYLFPSKTEGVRSKGMPGGPGVRFQETFIFDDVNLAEIEKSTLRLVLHSRRKTRGNRESFLGEFIVKCCDADLVPDKVKDFDFQTLRTRAKTGSTCEKYLFEDLGSLFVCIEYQPAASRMKVMVRKATNLPKSDKLIGRPGHYVTINLIKGREIVKSQDTRSQTGYSPIWNQPFLFDLPGSDVDEYYLDFIVMRGKIHTKDAIVGHVTIGSTCGKTGRSHWKEIMSPRPLETAKWHSILPMFNFKPSLTSD